MATDRRLLRLQQLILETLATAVQRDVEDPRVTLVTITRVKLARDLTQATVWWSTLAEGAQRRTVERGLQDALPYLQAVVAEAMTTRQTPHLSLRYDEGLEHAARVQELIARVAREREQRGEPPPPPAPGSEELEPPPKPAGGASENYERPS